MPAIIVLRRTPLVIVPTTERTRPGEAFDDGGTTADRRLDMLHTASEDVTSTSVCYRGVLGATVQSESPHWPCLRLGNVDVGVHSGPHDIPGGVSFQFRDPTGSWLAAIQYGVNAAQLATVEA